MRFQGCSNGLVGPLEWPLVGWIDDALVQSTVGSAIGGLHTAVAHDNLPDQKLGGNGFGLRCALYTGQGLVVGVAVGQNQTYGVFLPLREGGPGIGAFILSVAGTNRRRWVDAVGCFTIQGHGVIAPDAFALALGILHGDITAKIPNSSLLHRALRQRGNARLFCWDLSQLFRRRRFLKTGGKDM